MNKFGLILLISYIVYVTGEAPLTGRYRQPQRFRSFARQEATTVEQPSPEDQTESTTTTATDDSSAPYGASGFRPGRAFNLPTEQDQPADTGNGASSDNAPYAPSGWKPSGRLLSLPSPARQQVAPQPAINYGTPNTQYGTPNTQYGAPGTDNAPEEQPDDEQTAEPDSESVDVEGVTPSDVNSQNTQNNVQPDAYYIQLSDGSLQPIVYVAPAVTIPNTYAKIQVQPVPVAATQPLIVNPILAPRVVSYNAQYQSW